jgi:hypothetical protein
MDDCAVCYEAVSESTGHCTLSCKHSFHIACLTRWSNEKPSCPLCRNPLGVTEAPAKQRAIETPDFTWDMENMTRFRILTATPGQGRQGIMLDLIRQVLGPEPTPPPPPPAPRPLRIINIGDGVQVSEGDVALVMESAHVTRGEAVRALRRYDGDIVDSIIMLTNPDTPTPRPPPPPRDPMEECSDDQATAWFLQELFDDTIYGWNSYSDMVYRMRNNTHKQEYWMHREFQLMETRTKLDAGYESA